MEDTQHASPLLALPAELAYHILGYLTPIHLARVACTCRRLRAQAYDDRIWQQLISQNLPKPITEPTPLKHFRDLYITHHPHWFLPKYRIWFADTEPNGKLLVARYDERRGCIEAYAVTAVRGRHEIEFWEKDTDVIIHSFDPRVSLDLNQPVLKLDVNRLRTNDQSNLDPSDRSPAASSRFSRETLMETFAEAGLYGSFMLTRALPPAAIGPSTAVWPPLRFPADARVRNDSVDGFSSAGHRPSTLGEVSQHNFRLRKWVEYTGRRSSPRIMSFTSPNGLSAAMGLGNYFAGSHAFGGSGLNVRMPEDITTYATLPVECYTPTKEKPWQGIWCGDYSGHGCEFLVVTQPDKADEKPLPSGMDYLREWFSGAISRRGSNSTEASFSSAQEQLESPEDVGIDGRDSPTQDVTDYRDAPSGRLEAIKLTGDPNIPRGEYTFIAPEIGAGGFVRVADEELFRGARVVRSAGHIAARGFREDQYTPSQLIMISENRLAQFWEGFGHISYYQRVDLEALMNV
ncbi:hypothetical protein WHR41_03956 [Cladosporium halotolerans]|uniref:F-box domain-containing protein n=1 Tax=Cladosporium halotolerans TaxID=1052096 RepID=A0AB34KVR0_9PEZI